MAKPLKFSPAKAAAAGASHREEEKPQLEKRILAAGRGTPGRKPDFPGEDVQRLNVFLPAPLILKLKKRALDEQKSLAQLVADMAKAHLGEPPRKGLALHPTEADLKKAGKEVAARNVQPLPPPTPEEAAEASAAADRLSKSPEGAFLMGAEEYRPTR